MSLPGARLEKLRVINVEDNKNDSELIQSELETAWDEVEMLRVDSRAAFVQALAEFNPDVVLSDFNLPDMNGEEALQIVRQTHPDIPVLMVTGALGDAEAVKLVRLGVRDYVMKDHLQRLPSAVQSALSLERGIRARKAAERSLEQSEADLRALVEGSPVAMIVDVGVGADEKILLMNRQFTKLFGYTLAEVPDISHWWDLAYPDERYREMLKAEWMEQTERAIRNHEAVEPKEVSVTCKDGSIRYVRVSQASAGNRNIVTFEDLTAEKRLEEALQEAVDRNRVMMATVNDAIVCIDHADIIYLWNHKAEEMFGYSAIEAIGQSLHQLITPARYVEASSKALSYFAQTGTGPIIGKTMQLDARRKDGSEFPVELSVSAMNIQGAWHATGIIRDIAERKQSEVKIARLNQLYAALSYCNQAIVHSKNETELFEQICKVAVQFGGFKMAWVGLIDPVTQMLTPVCSVGEGAEAYLHDIKISADAASPFGQGPTGHALRDNQPFWCQDFVHSPLTHPWRERGNALGWKSSASLPLHREGVVFAAFTLYAAEPNAFDPDVRNLLIEMSTDIDFALENFRHEADRKKGEEELRQLSLAVQQSPSSIVITDLEANIQYVNEAFVRVTGYSREEVLGKNPRILHSGKNPPELYPQMWACLSAGEVWQGELVNRRKNGSEYVESVLISPVFDQKGRPQNYLGIKMDITERKQAEVRQSRYLKRVAGLLRINELGGRLEEKEFLRRGLELVEDLTESKISFIHFVNENQQSIELTAWSARTMAKYCTASYESHYPASGAGIWADCLRQHKPVIVNDYSNHPAKHGLPEGHSILERFISVPVIEENQVRVILGVGNKESDYSEEDVEVAQLFGNDIWRIIRRQRVEAELASNLERTTLLNEELQDSNASLKSARQQLLQSEKMAAIGLLAAGVAHEINNPVGYVNSNLGTLEKYLADVFLILDKYESVEPLLAVDDTLLAELRDLKAKVDLKYIREDLASLVSESHQGLERIKKIVLDLKDFSRTDAEEHWMWADVHHGLDSTLNVVWNELKYKCEVVKEYGTLPEIYCLPSQLNQVFMNLLVNAAQAIEVRGKITLRTGQEGERVWIEVSDTGKGISREHIHRLFDPFFTTKPVGKGTGLGLSVSYNIVEKHHGSFEVTSEVGQGTTFRIWLPVKQPETKEKA